MRIGTMLCAVGLIALCGCVNTRQVSAPTGTSAAYEGKPLTTVTYKKPSFAALTWGKAAIGGMLAGLAEISEGNRVINENAVDDPAVAIAGKLTPFFAEKMKTTGGAVLADQDGNDVKKLSLAAGGHGVVLDVETINWMFLYFPFDWSHYKVMYTGRARLIDAETGKEIALVPCQWDSGDKDPPDYDALLGDHAALLKAKLATAAETCAATYQAKMFAE